MILRVDIDNVTSMVELEGEPWTPELLQTLLRICGDEVVRTAIALGMNVPEPTDETEPDASPE